MARPEEDRYTDLLRHLASPSRQTERDEFVDSLREAERLFSMGHITEWQLDQARDAYAATLEREPRLAPPPSLETLLQNGPDRGHPPAIV